MTTSQSRSPVLVAHDLSVAWEDSSVVKGVSFELFSGEMICLVGRSGSGKTTLFHALAGLVMPSSGEVFLKGENITGKPGHVSYMLQKDLLLKEHTVLDNVALPLLVGGVKKSVARERASKLFGTFGIEGTQKRWPSELSGGMRQRAALLRTYLSGNDVILMDEPFSALDALTRIDMRRWFSSMMSSLGFAGILITHDVDEAIALGDKIMVLGKPETEDGADDCANGVFASEILATFDIDCPREDREDFLMSQQALNLKGEVLSYL